ncbi:MAG: hypothetical protein K9N46_12320 [Candidatus Marinimicrobia bacterium]|nr:hypothetical protein [Candidatus Neomarinimicrobiota bacterium]MCF7829085.1 hypothetical protein [Candidatus Neomarinimicrobiota bacterium]MCF7881516.1 hypothetical protein [Candidatus Neomarinimicrobiota bacterium]
MKRIIYIIGITIVLQGLSGCDALFNTRAVEPPEQTSGGQWQPPTTPEQVLTNMENAVLERNADNFIRCLSDSTAGEKPYEFIPDDETNATYSQIFQDWHLEDEKRVFQEMDKNVPRDSLFQLSFAEDAEKFETTDSARIEILYTLRVHHTLENLPRDVRGRALFTFSRNESQRNWVLHRWKDFREENAPSWSRLKAGF